MCVAVSRESSAPGGGVGSGGFQLFSKFTLVTLSLSVDLGLRGCTGSERCVDLRGRHLSRTLRACWYLLQRRMQQTVVCWLFREL